MRATKTQAPQRVSTTFNTIISKLLCSSFAIKTQLNYIDVLKEHIISGFLLERIQNDAKHFFLYRSKNIVQIPPQDLINFFIFILVDNEMFSAFAEIDYLEVFEKDFVDSFIVEEDGGTELVVDVDMGASYFLENFELIVKQFGDLYGVETEDIDDSSNGEEETESNFNEGLQKYNDKIKFKGSQVQLEDSINFSKTQKISQKQNKDIMYPNINEAASKYNEMLEINIVGIDKSKNIKEESRSTQILCNNKKHPAFYLQKNAGFSNINSEKGELPYYSHPSMTNNVDGGIRPMASSQYLYNETVNYNSQFYGNQLADTRKGRQGRKTTLSQDRPFVCEIHLCNSAFKRYEHLKRHKKIHTGEKPFSCPFMGCDKRFARSDNMTQHMKLHNTTKGRTQTGDNNIEFDNNEDKATGFHNMYDRL